MNKLHFVIYFYGIVKLIFNIMIILLFSASTQCFASRFDSFFLKPPSKVRSAYLTSMLLVVVHETYPDREISCKVRTFPLHPSPRSLTQ